jgi:hypothetical protein
MEGHHGKPRAAQEEEERDTHTPASEIHLPVRVVHTPTYKWLLETRAASTQAKNEREGRGLARDN